MRHLTSDEMIDALDGTLTGAPARHLQHCATCRDQLADVEALIGTLRSVEVPDPPAALMARVSATVRAAIEADTSRARPAPWLAWRLLVPSGALVAVVVALVSTLAARAPLSTAAAGSELAAMIGDTELAPDLDADASWRLLGALVAESDPTTLSQAEILAPAGLAGSIDRVVIDLTPQEQAELMRLLREELDGTGG
jgi:hypothetical protein